MTAMSRGLRAVDKWIGMRDTRYLEERLSLLEDLQKRSRGEAVQPQVCASCYFIRDGTEGCLCNSTSWTFLPVVILQIAHKLDEVQSEERKNRSSAA